ncbi:MAG TPA: DUF58 domain-containing protein [Phycisphaerales bacterium]|nr:DUF58 domain-containing protein [Phycisphaerales bacterium]HMP36046.1 DUF58 domain-containing protein [Phycisphaerales bacterium]
MATTPSTTPRAIQAEQYLAPETLAQIAPFELRAKMIVEGLMSGMHRSPYQGQAVEFAQHRAYVPGDPLRHLDWKVFGRSDKLYLKQYHQETNLDVVVLVDGSGSMTYGSLKTKEGWGGTIAGATTGTWTKYDAATALAVAIACLCLGQGDRIGVAVYADELRTPLRRSSARDQWKTIVQTLSTQPVESRANLVKSAEQALGKVTNRALFMVISDFLDDPEAIRSALARFRHRRDDVVLLQMLDRREILFDFDAEAPFEGLEGEARIVVEPDAFRGAYLEALRRQCDAVAAAARSFGFDYLRLDSHESVGPALSRLLARRGAQARRGKRS